jgi:hypothetical protein
MTFPVMVRSGGYPFAIVFWDWPGSRDVACGIRNCSSLLQFLQKMRVVELPEDGIAVPYAACRCDWRATSIACQCAAVLAPTTIRRQIVKSERA